MAAEVRIADATESNRFKAQGNSLGTLLARFTADRDALITAVRECEDQLAAIAARLDANPTGAPQGLDELRQLIEQLQLAQRQVEADARAHSEQALARAEDAARHIEELLAVQRARDERTSDLLAGLTADRDTFRTAVQQCEQRLTALAGRVDADPAGEPPSLHALQQRIEQLQAAQQQAEVQTRATSGQALSRAEEALRNVEELAGTQRRRADEGAELLARATAKQDALKAGLDVCQLQLAAIAARLDRMPAADPAQIDELRRLIERSEMAQREADAHIRATSERAMARAEEASRGIEELRAGQRAEDNCGKALEALRTATERLTTVFEGVDTRLEQLPPTAGSSDEATSQLAARVHGVEAKLAALQLTAESRPVQAAPPERIQGSMQRRWLPPALVTLGLVLASLLVAVMRWQDTLSRRPTVEHSPQLSPQTVELAPRPQPVPVTEASAQPQTEAAQVGAETAAPNPPEAIPGSSIVALEPQGTTTCRVEPEVNRVCVYHRAAEGIAAHGCYTFVGARVSEWPRWSVAGESTAQRIQLIDESGHASLQVVAEGTSADGDMAQLRQPDFDALVSNVVPWRTVWVVAQERTAPAKAADVAAVRDALERWRQAWEGKRFDEYAGYYSASFVPQSERDLARWRRYKQRLFERSGSISVQVAAPSILMVDKGSTALITFEQSYGSKTFASRARKVMRWQRDGERWTISAEAVLHEVAEPTGSKPAAYR